MNDIDDIPSGYLSQQYENDPLKYRYKCVDCGMSNDSRYRPKYLRKGYSIYTDGDGFAAARVNKGCRNCGSDQTVHGIKQ